MRPSALLLRSCLLAFVAAGCTQYHYYARKPNADGRGHEALASWSVTERVLWFDESSETVRVTMQCGRTIPFQEREGGVYVLYDPSVWANPRSVGSAQYCGQVAGIASLDEISEGDDLSLELWCTPLEDDEGFTVPAPILPSGEHAFDSVRREQRAPATKPCSGPPDAAAEAGAP